MLELNSCFCCQTALTAPKEGRDHRNLTKEFMLMPSNPYSYNLPHGLQSVTKKELHVLSHSNVISVCLLHNW